MVHDQVKKIETRMRDIIPEGDIIICCGKKSMTRNKGLALCIVNVSKSRPMTEGDADLACIESIPGRIAYDLSNWRYFNSKFEFSKHKVRGSFQSIFTIKIPPTIIITNATT